MLLHLASNQRVPHRRAVCRYGAGLPRATQRLHFCLFCVLSRLCCCEHVAWFWKQRKGRVRRLSCPPAGAVPVPSHSAWVSGAGPLGWGCLQAALLLLWPRVPCASQSAARWPRGACAKVGAYGSSWVRAGRAARGLQSGVSRELQQVPACGCLQHSPGLKRIAEEGKKKNVLPGATGQGDI